MTSFSIHMHPINSKKVRKTQSEMKHEIWILERTWIAKNTATTPISTS
jgi:hypothetical protein